MIPKSQEVLADRTFFAEVEVEPYTGRLVLLPQNCGAIAVRLPENEPRRFDVAGHELPVQSPRILRHAEPGTVPNGREQIHDLGPAERNQRRMARRRGKRVANRQGISWTSPSTVRYHFKAKHRGGVAKGCGLGVLSGRLSLSAIKPSVVANGWYGGRRSADD